MKLVLSKLRSIIKYLLKQNDTKKYWDERAKTYGHRSVLNLGHSENDLESITANQKKIIFPILQNILTGNEKTILDFGCGTGRFTKHLADLIDGHCIGVDTTEPLLKLAIKTPNVEYQLINSDGSIPLNSNSIDVVWICLVLGGIVDEKAINKTKSEIGRILKKNGILILVENTMNKKSSNYWKFRTINYYQEKFHEYNLKHETDYFDLGERISVFSGKKR